MGNLGHLTYLGKDGYTAAARAALPIPTVCTVFLCPHNSMAASVGFLTCTQMLVHATAHWGCTNTVHKSALQVDSRGNNLLSHLGIKPMEILHLVQHSTNWATVPLCSNSNHSPTNNKTAKEKQTPYQYHHHQNNHKTLPSKGQMGESLGHS